MNSLSWLGVFSKSRLSEMNMGQQSSMGMSMRCMRCACEGLDLVMKSCILLRGCRSQQPLEKELHLFTGRQSRRRFGEVCYCNSHLIIPFFLLPPQRRDILALLVLSFTLWSLVRAARRMVSLVPPICFSGSDCGRQISPRYFTI